MCLEWLHCITSESQWLQYFKLVFLEIQNVPLRTVFANPVTYSGLTVDHGEYFELTVDFYFDHGRSSEYRL